MEILLNGVFILAVCSVTRSIVLLYSSMFVNQGRFQSPSDYKHTAYRQMAYLIFVFAFVWRIFWNIAKVDSYLTSNTTSIENNHNKPRLFSFCRFIASFRDPGANNHAHTSFYSLKRTLLTHRFFNNARERQQVFYDMNANPMRFKVLGIAITKRVLRRTTVLIYSAVMPILLKKLISLVEN